LAVSEQAVDVIPLLLRAPGIDVNKPGAKDFTALLHYLVHPNDKVKELLYSAKGLELDLNAVMQNRMTPLTAAVSNMNVAMIKCLAAQPGIQLHKPDHDGFNAMTKLATKGEEWVDDKVLTMLLDLPDNDINGKDANGESLITMAVLSNNKHMVASLIKKDANVNTTNDQGENIIRLILF
jgi:ankyrin repeat protein